MALGSKVSVRKLKSHPQGYRWRATFIEGGKRRQKYFKTKAKADEFAESREEEALEQGTGTRLSQDERSAVVESRGELSQVGLDLRSAIQFAVESKRELSQFGVAPNEALDFALAYYQQAKASIEVSILVNQLVEFKGNAGRSKRHQRDLKSKLGRFCQDFGQRSVATIEAKELEAWLHQLKLKPSSVNSYRRVLNLFFNHAKKRGFCDSNPVESVDRVKEVEAEPQVLTVPEIKKLLASADLRILPAMAIAAFAGLRTSEISGTEDHAGLDWEKIDFEEGTILVRADVAKGRRKRHVPISENLRTWLEPYAQSKGNVWPVNGRKLEENARRKAGFGRPGSETPQEKRQEIELKAWPHNAFRHSYASYHLAKYRNPGELVLYMGHKDDADTLYNNYRGLVRPSSATAYWNIGRDTA